MSITPSSSGEKNVVTYTLNLSSLTGMLKVQKCVFNLTGSIQAKQKQMKRSMWRISTATRTTNQSLGKFSKIKTFY